MRYELTIYILGMGAVGSLLAAELWLNGQNIVALCRGAHYEAICSHGLKYRSLEGECTTISIGNDFAVFNTLYTPDSGFSNLDVDDSIYITSKVHGLESLIKQYASSISDHGSVILAQNGIGNEELVLGILPNIRVYRLLTTNGALLESPGSVRHTGSGYTKIGYPKSNRFPVYESEWNGIMNVWKGCSVSPELEPKIDVYLWEKIFVNIGINAIASIENISNGKLLETEGRKKLMRDAIIEAWKIAQALLIPVEPSPNKYVELTYEVCANTRPNRNSMLQDLDHNRKTEIDFINGKIVEFGKKLGISTPINQKLTQQIKDLERHGRT